MTNYYEKLDANYALWREEYEAPPQTKYEHLGQIVFDFTTYDSEMDEYFAKRMIEVCEVILNKKTFDYIKGKESYINYLTMVNMPFLANKLEWGTSIRGAWFDDSKEYEIDCGRIIIGTGELKDFIKQLIDWCRHEHD